MATISASEFFGGKPAQPTATAAAPTPAPAGGYVQGVKDAAKAGIDKTKQGVADIGNAKTPLQLIEGAAKQGAGIIDTASSPLAPIFSPLGKLIGYVSDQLSNHPAVQKFAMSPAGDVTSRVAEDVGNLNTIAGAVASVAAAPKVANATADAAAAGGEGVAKTVTVAGRASKGAGEAVYKSAITPNVKEASQLLNYEAKAPFLTRVKDTLTGLSTPGKPITRADTALQTGIAGRQKDIGVQATRAADKLWNDTIAPAVKGSKEVVTKNELFAPISKRIAETVEPGRKQALTDAFAAIQDEYKNVSQFTLETAQKVKQGLDQFTPEKVFRGKSVASEYRTLQNDMANAIRQKTYAALKDVNIRKAYLDYGNLAELKKIGVKAITEATSKGGFGSFWTGAWDMATVPVKTVGGQVLYRVGNKLEFLGEKGIKTFGQFLKARGYNRP